MSPIPETSGSIPMEVNPSVEQGKRLGARGRTSGEQDRSFASIALPMMKEYSEKLDSYSQRLLAVWNQKGSFLGTWNTDQELIRDTLIRAVKYLKPSLRKWIDAGSAMVEEGRLSGAERLALETRLAELEVQYLNILDVVKLFGESLAP